MENKFINYAKENINRLNNKLEEILNNNKINLPNKNILEKYFNVFIDSSEGGKRIRPLLIMLRIQDVWGAGGR